MGFITSRLFNSIDTSAESAQHANLDAITVLVPMDQIVTGATSAWIKDISAAEVITWGNGAGEFEPDLDVQIEDAHDFGYWIILRVEMGPSLYPVTGGVPDWGIVYDETVKFWHRENNVGEESPFIDSAVYGRIYRAILRHIRDYLRAVPPAAEAPSCNAADHARVEHVYALQVCIGGYQFPEMNTQYGAAATYSSTGATLGEAITTTEEAAQYVFDLNAQYGAWPTGEALIRVGPSTATGHVGEYEYMLQKSSTGTPTTITVYRDGAGPDPINGRGWLTPTSGPARAFEIGDPVEYASAGTQSSNDFFQRTDATARPFDERKCNQYAFGQIEPGSEDFTPNDTNLISRHKAAWKDAVDWHMAICGDVKRSDGTVLYHILPLGQLFDDDFATADELMELDSPGLPELYGDRLIPLITNYNANYTTSEDFEDDSGFAHDAINRAWQRGSAIMLQTKGVGAGWAATNSTADLEDFVWAGEIAQRDYVVEIMEFQQNRLDLTGTGTSPTVQDYTGAAGDDQVGYALDNVASPGPPLRTRIGFDDIVEDFEVSPDATALTTANTTWDNVNKPTTSTINSDSGQAIVGTFSAEFFSDNDGNNGDLRGRWGASLHNGNGDNPNNVMATFHARWSAFESQQNNQRFFRLRCGGVNGSVNAFFLAIDGTSNKVIVLNADAVQVAEFTTALSTATWYRFAVSAVMDGSLLRWAVAYWADLDATPTELLSGAYVVAG